MRKRNVKNALVKTIAFVSATAMLSTSFSTISFAKEVPEDTEIADSAYSEVVESDLVENIALEEIEEVAAAVVENTEAGDFDEDNAEAEEAEVDEAETEEVDVADEEAEAVDSEDSVVADVENEDIDADDSEAVEVEAEDAETEDTEYAEAGEVEVEDAESEDSDIEDAEAEEVDVEEAEAEEIDTEEEVSIANELGTVTNGWEKQSDGTYKYYENGVAVTSQVKKIGNDYFGFDRNGIMYDDEVFVIYNEDDNNYYYYRAKKGGYLCVNSWYEDEDGHKYYYGEGGRAAKSYAVLTIDGVKYIFYNGALWSSFRGMINGVMYASDGDGRAYTLKTNGWTKVGEEWYYFENGNFRRYTVFQDGGKYYFWLDSPGKVLRDDYATIGGYAYRAKADCSLYVNEWYTNKGEKYYYGEGGKAPLSPCVQTIDGKQYLFESRGLLFTKGSATIDGVTYISDENGIAIQAPLKGWCQVGKDWYYIENGNIVTNQIKEIGSFCFGFNSDGRMYVNTTFGMDRYDEDHNYLGYFEYYADAEGHLLRNTWKRYGDRSSYYAWEYARVKGWRSIAGTMYFFDNNGYMMESCYVMNGNDIYRLRSDGGGKKITNANDLFYDVYEHFAVYYEDGTLIKNAWKEINGKWFYFDSEGSAVRGEVRKIANAYYAFNADGTMATKGWVKIGNNTFYVTNADGNLATGQQKIGDKWYYFDDNGQMKTGLIKYNDKLYILNPDGSWAVTAKEGWNYCQGTYYYVKDGNFVRNREIELADGNYYFDYDGAMVKNSVNNRKYYGADGKEVTKTGWYKVDTKWIYIRNGSLLSNVVETINNTEYAFYYNGFMVSNDWYNGIYYNANGIAVKRSTKDGWQLYGGDYYYYKNGSLVYDTWVGDYYIGRNGFMLRNEATPDNYYVGNDGKYVKNTIYNGKVVKSNGKIAKNEFVTIGSKKYYAMEYGYACTYEAYVIGKNLYQFKESYVDGYPVGEYVKTIATDVKNETWYQFGNQWTYVRDGQVILNGIAEIGGVKYYFSNGVMMTNCTTDASITGDYYSLDNSRLTYFGNDGKEVKNRSGWVDGYYYGTDHRTTYGWVQVNGKLYHGYSDPGRSEYEVINGKIYQFDTKTGAFKNEVYKYNGWLQVGSDWYYFENGTAVTGAKTIGKATYAFDYYDGHMLKNSILYTYSLDIYYVNSEGIIDTKSGFRTVNGQQIYIDKDGKVLKGIHVINGKTYYFEGYGYK